MFDVGIPSFVHTTPWLAKFPSRLKQLSRGERRIAYFYETPDSSTFRYRAYNMIQAIEYGNRDFSASYFCMRDIDEMNYVLDLAHVLVLVRVRFSPKIQNLVRRAKDRGLEVVFDTDDLVFNTDYAHLIAYTLNQDVTSPQTEDYWLHYLTQIGSTLRACDRAITTNAFLADRIKEYAPCEVSVIENFLNQEQINISNRIFSHKMKSGFRTIKGPCMGYFSGTPSHNRDFKLISSALAAVLKKYKTLRLRIVGYLDIPDTLKAYNDRIDVYPLVDFLSLQRLIGETELNLVPLQNNAFTNCKSELKYFEAAAVGTISAVSPTFTLKRCIDGEKNGFICNAHEWEHKLDLWFSDYQSHYESQARNAHIHAMKTYSYTVYSERIRAAFSPKTS